MVIAELLPVEKSINWQGNAVQGGQKTQYSLVDVAAQVTRVNAVHCNRRVVRVRAAQLRPKPRPSINKMRGETNPSRAAAEVRCYFLMFSFNDTLERETV